MKQNEIWLVNLNPTLGAEIQKTRPAVIINDNSLGKLPLKVIVPITDWKEHYESVPWMVTLMPDNQNNLTKPSSIDCFQIRSIDQERMIRKIGMAQDNIASQIKEAIKRVLTIE